MIAKRGEQLAAQFTRYEAEPLTQAERDTYAALRRQPGRLHRPAEAGRGQGHVRRRRPAACGSTTRRCRPASTPSSREWDRLVDLNAAGAKASGTRIEETYAAAEPGHAGARRPRVDRRAGRPGDGAARRQPAAAGDLRGDAAPRRGRHRGRDPGPEPPGRDRRAGRFRGGVPRQPDPEPRPRGRDGARPARMAETQRRAATRAMADGFEQAVGGIVGLRLVARRPSCRRPPSP